MKDPFKQIVEEVLTDEGTRGIVRELGIQDAPAIEQEMIISGIGETIMARLVVEIMKALPLSEHEKFESLLGSGDAAGIRELISQYIPNADEFIRHEISKEYEATKSAIQQASQEA